jgi:hypothetical protein
MPPRGQALTRLYSRGQSGNSYKVLLLLHQLRRPYPAVAAWCERVRGGSDHIPMVP